MSDARRGGGHAAPGAGAPPVDHPGEEHLAAIGVFRIPLPIPFPEAGGPVNVYLVEEADGGLLMWDAGLGSAEAEAALEEGFRRLGRRFEDVRRIFLSHGHVDHYGAARLVEERSGRKVPVHCHRHDAPKVAGGGQRWREIAPALGRHLARLGAPPDAVETTIRQGNWGFSLARPFAEVLPLEEGTVLRTRHLALEVLHMPGHTPGLCCLYDRERRLFFSGDHLLQRVSPNPLIELGPDGDEGWFRPLVSYFASVARTRALEIDLVLPGHGPPFSGHRAVIDRLVHFYGKRQARIREVLAEGPRSVWEVARALFPSAPLEATYLTMSETLANLEVMEERGEVRRSVVDGVVRFR